MTATYDVPFAVGAAAVDITPPVGTVYLGVSPRQQRFTEIESPLEMRAVVFRCGPIVVVCVSVDLIGLGCLSPLTGESLGWRIRGAAAARLGVEVSHVLVAATHAHSTPETSGITNVADPATLAWIDTLPHAAADVAGAAFRDCAAATLSGRKVVVRGIAKIRRTRAHAVPSFAPDESLSMLIARRGVGKPPVVLMNFACHPVLLQARPAVSADYPGFVVASLGRAGIFGFFMQGAEGDVNPASEAWGSTEQVQRDAELIADAAAAAVQSYAPAGDVPEVLPLAAGEIHLELTKRAPLRQESSGTRKAVFERPDDDPAGLAQRLGDPAAPLDMTLQCIRIGPVGIVAVPGEPVTALGTLIKAMSPSPLTFVGACCNDYHGYLVPPWDWPDGGYEVGFGPWSLVYGKSTMDIVTAAVSELGRLWAAPKPEGSR